MQNKLRKQGTAYSTTLLRGFLRYSKTEPVFNKMFPKQHCFAEMETALM